MTELRFPGQAPSQVARHFLELLDDVYRIHGLYQEEIKTLRAKVTALEASRKPGKAALPSVPDVPGCAVYLVSQEGTIQSWSGGACDIYGYSVEEVLGQHPAMLRPQGGRAATSAPKSTVALPACPRLNKDGHAFAVYLHQTVLLDQDGHPCGRMHVEIPLGSNEAAAAPANGSAL